MQFYPVVWDGTTLDRELFTQCNEAETLIVVQYGVKKAETKQLDLSRARVMLDSISGIGAPARESLLFYFDGYDHDRRELSQIPEVVAYIKRVVEAFPNIFYFLHPAVNSHIFVSLTPHTLISSPLLSTGQKHVMLDIPVAQRKFREISEAVKAYGASIGDEAGARDVLREWRQTLNL